MDAAPSGLKRRGTIGLGLGSTIPDPFWSSISAVKDANGAGDFFRCIKHCTFKNFKDVMFELINVLARKLGGTWEQWDESLLSWDKMYV